MALIQRFCDPAFNHFGTVPAYNRQMDTQRQQVPHWLSVLRVNNVDIEKLLTSL